VTCQSTALIIAVDYRRQPSVGYTLLEMVRFYFVFLVTRIVLYKTGLTSKKA